MWRRGARAPFCRGHEGARTPSPSKLASSQLLFFLKTGKMPSLSKMQGTRWCFTVQMPSVEEARLHVGAINFEGVKYSIVQVSCRRPPGARPSLSDLACFAAGRDRRGDGQRSFAGLPHHRLCLAWPTGEAGTRCGDGRRAARRGRQGHVGAGARLLPEEQDAGRRHYD